MCIISQHKALNLTQFALISMQKAVISSILHHNATLFAVKLTQKAVKSTQKAVISTHKPSIFRHLLLQKT